jgi:sec-independent protein translocase protein TatA
MILLMYEPFLLFLNLGGSELVLIILVFLMFFGAKNIPNVARGLGKGIRDFKDAANGIQRDIQESTKGIRNDLDEATGNLRKQMNEHVQDVNEAVSSVKRDADVGDPLKP